MATPREHIEEIRKNKFSIGKEPNPLTEDLHQSVKIFSAELYSKDVHFLMELLQNAEDNEYAEGVDPSLEFIVTSRDITGTDASSTLLIFNNERGFSHKNIDSICSVGRSTKKGNRKRGYIGEKGIGFKSVFLITSRPYIFSAGYMIRFNEEPCPECNVGYIVPEWVEENPIVPNIKSIYGSATSLPTTTLVLPLKPDKVLPVKKELSSIHPEILLFLTKIKNFSVKEDNEDPKLSTLCDLAISSETDFVTRKNMNAESYTVHLSTGENVKKFDSECRYYMWRQRFPVKQENRVERRMEVEEWNITLAFPYGPRLERRTNPNSPGVFAYLPTEMITNFPFIIQADFILASSRETFLVDNKWNQGILDCVPSAFMNAFRSLVKETDCPVFNLPNIFGFLPVDCSSYPYLDSVRDIIKAMIADQNIVPCESYTTQKFFHKPSQVGRLMPRFWDILVKARVQGVCLDSLSSHGKYILSSSFDKSKYDKVLNFMGVKQVENEWYEKCISSSNLVRGVSEGVYIDLLIFLAENWSSRFQNTAISSVPLLKYVDSKSTVFLCSVSQVKQSKIQVLMSETFGHISWLVNWNQEFRISSGFEFMPISTQKEILSSNHREMILNWLANNVTVKCVDVKEYANRLSSYISFDRKVAISYTHFLYHSLSEDFLTKDQVKKLCNTMPLVDNYGFLTTQRNGVLVPASGSEWAKLVGSNPWRSEGYVELTEEYLHPAHFAGLSTADKGLTPFLNVHVGASDIPYLNPPNTCIPSLSSPLTKQNAFLVLGWIRQIRYSMPSLFLSSIKEGSWLRVSLSGSPSYKPPSESFLVASSWGNLLQDKSVLVDIPMVDQEFYGTKILEFRDELRAIGVKSEFGEACNYMGERLMSFASSSALSRSNVFSILKFIRFLREKMLPVDDFICSLKKGKWLRTSLHDQSPEGSVLFDEDWRAAKQISDIPFIDSDYYGKEIFTFKSELQLLGVVIGFSENYELVTEYLKSSVYINPLTAEVFVLMLRCIRHTYPDKFVRLLKDNKCIKTDAGNRAPSECFLFNHEWGGLMQVFNGFPLIDQEFYGKDIESFKTELRHIGVVVEFEKACQRFTREFQQHVRSYSISKDHVMSFLTCYRKLEGKFPRDLQKCVRESQWLRTRLTNFMLPKDCILFGPDWKAISKISLLPFIDDGENGYGSDIREFKKELKRIGVVVDLKDGVKIVASHLCFPQNSSTIAPKSVQSLLECIRLLQSQWEGSMRESVLKKVSTDWVKTHLGYLPPDRTLLFDDPWGKFLQKEDGPFIDEEFYGFNISSYKQELQSIGVVVDVAAGSSLLAECLGIHSEFTTIVRIYEYLRKMKWKPEGELSQKLWIPNGGDKGEWVNCEECLLCDRDDLFGMQLHILDQYYEHSLLYFFRQAYQVRSSPSVNDYSNLWKAWQSSADRKLSSVNCCAFWEHVAGEWTLWNGETRKTLADSLVKLPTECGSNEILLANKDDVFIGDDLLLKDLFQASSERPIFVWHPRPSLASLPLTKLLDIYAGVGVRTISQSVVKKEAPVMEDGAELKQVDSILRKGLFKLVLGFLAGSKVGMELEKRVEVAKRLVSLEVFETAEPISVSYSLALSSGEVITVEASRMVRWDREKSKLFVQKVEKSVQKNAIVFATYFSEAVSEGLLWDMEDHICDLSELIKLGFLVGFDEEAVEFLMKKNNLHVSEEEEAFLSSIPA